MQIKHNDSPLHPPLRGLLDLMNLLEQLGIFRAELFFTNFNLVIHSTFLLIVFCFCFYLIVFFVAQLSCDLIGVMCYTQYLYGAI